MVIYILEIVMITQKFEYQINAFHFHGLEHNLNLANKKVERYSKLSRYYKKLVLSQSEFPNAGLFYITVSI